MPMNWNTENDRILLLKLIETHGISVDSAKIAAAWPKDAPVKPTSRAITERFVKLRKMAGINATITTSTPSKARARPSKYVNTPSSSTKKRKAKGDSESDAEDDITDGEDTPTKKKPAQRGGSKSGGRGGVGSSVRVKTEFPDNSFTNAEDLDFEALSAHATRLREAVNNGGTPDRDYLFSDHGIPNYGSSPVSAFASASNGLNGFTDQSFLGFGSGNNGLGAGLSGFGVTSNGMGFSLNSKTGSMPVQAGDPLSTPTRRLNFNATPNSTHPANGAANRSPTRATRPSAAPSNDSAVRTEQRARSARKASQQASEGMAAWIQQQKAEDREDGQKSSEEDSAASEFRESDGEYV